MVVTIPQQSYKGRKISYEQFSDILIIGMNGLTDYLMDENSLPYIVDGMVNYQRVANNLGLVFEEKWIKHFGSDMENHGGLLISHDCAPEAIEQDDDGCWAYLNSGFDRIGDLLYQKYYLPKQASIMTYEEFQIILLGEIVGLLENGISIPQDSGMHNQYDLKETARFFEIPCSDEWIDRFSKYAVENNFLIANPNSTYSLTERGMAEARDAWENMGADGYLMATQGESKLYFSVDASHISRLGLELVAKQETAIAELVKNGYDADATNVDLIVSTDGPKTSLEIMDNGSVIPPAIKGV